MNTFHRSGYLVLALVAVGWISTRASTAQEVDATDSSAIPLAAVADELVRMYDADQAARDSMVQKYGTWPPKDSSDMAFVDSLDRAHAEYLEDVVGTHGWPTASMVGKRASHAAWLIAQHSDHDRAFQERVLDLVRRAAEAGEEEWQKYAMLFDRIRVLADEPQVFGTQVTLDEKGDPLPFPIEDEENVDARREEVGLGPLDEYIDSMKEMLEKSSQNGS